MLNFAVLTFDYTNVLDGIYITVTTDVPCHLYARMTLVPPVKHKEAIIVRGLPTKEDTRFCFVAYEDNEQFEPGDTLTHTFRKPAWPICETRYFFFLGTIGGVESPSTTAYFTIHRTAITPTQFFFAYEPDTCIVGSAGAWVTVTQLTGGSLKDLLPPEASVAFLHIINDDSARRIGLRPTGSTHNETDTMLEHSHTWTHVALDGDNAFDIFLGSHLNQSVYLMGYAIDPAVIMLDNPTLRTLLVNWNWQAFDLSVLCPDAIAILCEAIRNVTGEIGGFRKHGSIDNRVTTLMHNWIVVGCDSDQKINVRSLPWGGFPGKFYITGYIKQSATFETNGINQSLTIAGSYQPVVVPQSCHLAFYEQYAPIVSKKLAMRPYGSTEDMYWQPNYRHIGIVGAPDKDLKLEGKIEDLGIDWFYLGSGF